MHAVTRYKCTGFVSVVSTLFLLLASAMTSAQEVDLFIIAGQSNAQGAGVVADVDPDLRGHINNFNKVLFASRTALLRKNNKKEVLGWGDVRIRSNNRFGVEFGLARRLYNKEKAYKSGQRQLAIYKYAIGGTALTPNPNNPDQEVWSKELVKHMIARTNARIEQLLKRPGVTKVNVKAMIWLQGEAEALHRPSEVAGEYDIFFRKMFRQMRDADKGIKGARKMHAAMLKLNTDAAKLNASSSAIAQTLLVNDAFDEMAERFGRFHAFVPFHTETRSDGIHYTGQALLMNGRFLADKLTQIKLD